jgi:type I restriction enzyme, R subunit
LQGFSEFSWNDLYMDQQTFDDFKSKYLDLKDRNKLGGEEDQAVSIIDEVDFELELIQRDEVNVAYILALLQQIAQDQDSIHHDTQEARDQKLKLVFDLLGSDVKLRSKRELIEKFIRENMPNIPNGQPVAEAFNDFWTEEKAKAIREICETEGLRPDALKSMIENYHFTGKEPLSETVVDALNQKPKILERKSIVQRVTNKLLALVRVFDEDLGDV